MKSVACAVPVILAVFFNVLSPVTPVLSEASLEQTMRMVKVLCKRNNGVKQEVLNRVKEGEFVDDPKFKCYVHCCLGMMKVMKKGKITPADATKQAEMLLPVNHRKLALSQLNACKDVGGVNACDVAYNFAKCAYKAEPTSMPIPL